MNQQQIPRYERPFDWWRLRISLGGVVFGWAFMAMIKNTLVRHDWGNAGGALFFVLVGIWMMWTENKKQKDKRSRQT